MGWANVDQHRRAIEPMPTPHRLKCYCGCEGKATHRGTCNGISMTDGCELHVRRWMKNWRNAVSVATRRAADQREGGPT